MNHETDFLRTLLLKVLRRPHRRAPLLGLTEWLEERGDSRAIRIRQYVERGMLPFQSYTLSGDGVGDKLGFVHPVILLVPQRVAVEFDCSCAEHVLPLFLTEFPDDDCPHRLSAAVRDWLHGRTTKKEVRRFLESMADLTDDEAAILPSWQEWSRERETARYAAVCAARAVAAVAVAVSFSATSEGWPQWVSQASVEAIAAATDHKAEKDWQRLEFLSLLQRTPSLENT